MSLDENSYCRLCAEPTPKDQLISSDEDVAISSKIAKKMQWINVDVSPSNSLPDTICFSCFDLLERTWTFLHNVRTAQTKLNEIFDIKVDLDLPTKDDVGKPVNENWEEFQTNKLIKSEVDEEPGITVIDASFLDVDNTVIKEEKHSDEDVPFNDTDFDTTDSDLPLQHTVKKKKLKKKEKESSFKDAAMDISMLTTTWDDYMCNCARCDAQCKNFTSLQLHSLQIHSSCCTFKCSDCGKVIGNYRSFVSHARMHKKLLRYCCEYCNKQFAMMRYVKKHQNTEHRNINSSLCKTCGALFETKQLLEDHLQIYSKDRVIKKRSAKLERDNELKCEHCNKEFKSRSNLRQHKFVHTERSRDFSCHVCGMRFYTKGTLSTHMMTHDDTKPFKCEFCPLAFRVRGNLVSHSSLHSGTKPFVCEQCGKSFRIKRHLQSHSIVHTDLMPYVCEYCNKPFRFKTRLNLHLRQHTGAKPYNCIYCQRDFTNGSNFKKHMKRRHNIDTSTRKKYDVTNSEQNVDNSNVIENSQT